MHEHIQIWDASGGNMTEWIPWGRMVSRGRSPRETIFPRGSIPSCYHHWHLIFDLSYRTNVMMAYDRHNNKDNRQMAVFLPPTQRRVRVTDFSVATIDWHAANRGHVQQRVTFFVMLPSAVMLSLHSAITGNRVEWNISISQSGHRIFTWGMIIHGTHIGVVS